MKSSFSNQNNFANVHSAIGSVEKLSRLRFLSLLFKSKTKIHPLFSKIQSSYGDRVFWASPDGQRFWYFNDAEAAKHILISKGLNYHKTAYTMELSGILGDGLVTSNGSFWQSHRKLIQPFFKAQNFKRMMALMEVELISELNCLADSVADQNRVEMNSFAHDITLTLIGKALMGFTDKNAFHILSNGINQFIDYTSQGVLIPRWMNIQKGRLARKAKEQIDHYYYSLIDERLSQNEPGDDFVSMLTQAHFKHPEIIDRKAIRDETVTMLGAGHGATANALFWSLSLLALHPEVQEALREELAEYSENDLLNSELTSKISGVRNVFHESLRLFPTAWVLARQAEKEDQIFGERIKQGDQVIIPVSFLQRHQKYWENPDLFIPQRFQGQEKEINQSGYYLPFNIGPRACIGRSFAVLKTCLILANIIKRYEIFPIEKQLPLPMYDILLRTPDKHYLKFVRV